MNKKFKHWIFLLIICVIIFYLKTLIVFNYFIDLEHIFRKSSFNNGVTEGNLRFNKIEYLEKHWKNYNSYLIGGSRIGVFKDIFFTKYIDSCRFYNLAFTQNSLDESYITSKYIIEHYRVDLIFLQLSLADLSYPLKKSPIVHYKISGKNKNIFIIKHFFDCDPINYIKQLIITCDKNDFFLKPTKPDGSWNCDAIGEAKSIQSIKNDLSTKKNSPTKRTTACIDFEKKIQYISNIKALCALNNTKLIIAFFPDNYKILNQFKTDDLIDFLNELCKINSFWNFSGYNTITINDDNYYDLSHFRSHIGKLIVSKIFNDTLGIPNDFGYYVTNCNVNQYLTFLRKNISDWDSSSTIINLTKQSKSSSFVQKTRNQRK